MLDLGSPPRSETISLDLHGVDESAGRALPEAMAILEELRAPRTQSLTRRLGLLAVSLLLFVSFGLLRWSLGDLVLLVIVVVIHEAGHYLAMLAFGYRDVRMFFIPLFGAAVTASDSSALGYQRALVALAGPAPGIAIGAAAAVLALAGGGPTVLRAAEMLLLLNAFNLLPVLPLDGGHILYETLFCRSRWLETAFQVLAAVALVLLAIWARDWWLALLGWLAIQSARSSFRLNGAVQCLRTDGSAAQMRSTSDATLEFVARASAELESAFERTLSQPALVNAIRTVIQKLRLQPPGAGATVVLLGAYGLSMLVALVGVVVVAATHARDAGM